jgi:hypothetical protein
MWRRFPATTKKTKSNTVNPKIEGPPEIEGPSEAL